jgi:hypothetical protein
MALEQIERQRAALAMITLAARRQPGGGWPVLVDTALDLCAQRPAQLPALATLTRADFDELYALRICDLFDPFDPPGVPR